VSRAAAPVLVARAAAAVLLSAPFWLALPAGGYRDVPRIVAGIAAWLLVALAAVLAPSPLPRRRAGRLALGGLAALAGLTLASVLWAPLAAPAYADAQRVALYLGVLLAAVAWLPAARALPAVEPALAACAALVVAYGLSERLFPWLVTLQRSVAAGGRLDQPLGYWNAMGTVAAVGFVLAASLAGDARRGPRGRAAAAALAPLLAAGVALTFSRGALLSVAVGVSVVLLARPLRSQARSVALLVAVGAVSGAVAAALPGVADYSGSSGRRALEGAVLAGVLVLTGALAAAGQAELTRREAAGRLGVTALGARLRGAFGAVAVAAVVAAVLLVIAGEGGSRTGTPQFGATASRLSSVQSNRYAYWRVAAAVFADHPVIGAGSSAFAVEWLRRRTLDESARDAHSLPLETLAELGLAGLIALALFGGGTAAAAWRLAREHPGAAAGAYGGLAAWAAHAAIDWDWEMPADTLFALLLAAAVIAAAERPAAAATAPPRG
jgi:hypothetical protein